MAKKKWAYEIRKRLGFSAKYTAETFRSQGGSVGEDDESIGTLVNKKKVQKAISTSRSRVVPHLSTEHALNRLTSEFGWDPVHLA